MMNAQKRLLNRVRRTSSHEDAISDVLEQIIAEMDQLRSELDMLKNHLCYRITHNHRGTGHIYSTLTGKTLCGLRPRDKWEDKGEWHGSQAEFGCVSCKRVLDAKSKG